MVFRPSRSVWSDTACVSFGDVCRFAPSALVRVVVSDRATSQTPLIGFVKDAPPSTSPWESTPGRAVARPSVRCVPSRALVPSLSFCPTSTVYSTHGFAGLLHPAVDPGVRRVSIPAGPTRTLSATVAELSSTAHALRSFSLACSTGPCRHVPCLLTVGSNRSSVGNLAIAAFAGPPSVSRLCSTDEAVANAPPLPVECCPLLPWASRSVVCPARPGARGSYGLSL